MPVAARNAAVPGRRKPEGKASKLRLATCRPTRRAAKLRHRRNASHGAHHSTALIQRCKSCES
jgi:hypothetical protein